jgi:predicted dehydrogenase
MPGDVEVVGACDVDADRLGEFGSRYALPSCHTDLGQMLREARPRLVHVCTPPAAHLDTALACLGAGASVLVEKPPTLSLADLHILAAIQPPAGPWIATVFQHRFGSGARRLRTMLDEGVLGRPLLAICHTNWFRAQEYFDVPWRGKWDTEGGGPTMGHGIHQMDLLTAILGDWTVVSAVTRRQARRTQTEDLSLAHVSFANGALASVVNSVLSPREESYLRFDFERATVELSHLYGYGDDDWRITPAPGAEEAVLEAWKAGETGVASGHRAQFAAVVASLRSGTAPPVSIQDAARTMRLVAGVYASAFTGVMVRPSDLGPSSPFYHRMSGDGPPWSISPGEGGS